MQLGPNNKDAHLKYKSLPSYSRPTCLPESHPIVKPSRAFVCPVSFSKSSQTIAIPIPAFCFSITQATPTFQAARLGAVVKRWQIFVLE